MGVVGVHHAVDEAQRHPAGDQLGLSGDGGAQEAHGPVRPRMVAPDRHGHQPLQRVGVAAGGEVLEGAPRGCARAPRASAPRRAAGRSRSTASPVAAGRQRARGGHAERGHGLGDDVLAQDGAHPGAPVAHAREGRGARPLELHVPAPPVGAHDLAQQVRAPVAELRRPAAELVPGIGLRQRLGPPLARRCRRTPAASRAGRSASSPISAASASLSASSRGSATGVGSSRTWKRFRQAGVGVVEAKRGHRSLPRPAPPMAGGGACPGGRARSPRGSGREAC